MNAPGSNPRRRATVPCEVDSRLGSTPALGLASLDTRARHPLDDCGSGSWSVHRLGIRDGVRGGTALVRAWGLSGTLERSRFAATYLSRPDPLARRPLASTASAASRRRSATVDPRNPSPCCPPNRGRPQMDGPATGSGPRATPGRRDSQRCVGDTGSMALAPSRGAPSSWCAGRRTDRTERRTEPADVRSAVRTARSPRPARWGARGLRGVDGVDRDPGGVGGTVRRLSWQRNGRSRTSG